MALATDLRAALRDGQLFVVYQPVVELGQGRLDGVEALARWRHPARGLVPPAEFIAIAEETGLIGELGDFVLRTACSDFAHWRATLGARAPRRIAVNLSRRQLDDDGFVDGVRDLLAQLGLPPPMLQLEITESLAAQGAEAVLRALKALGVQLSLDDFGTGYSSLACLHQLPVDRVKIDRSFVAHAETVEYHRVLIEATTRVARTLGMHTVAEGIETRGQARLMAALGCDGGQGWLFGRPLPAGELLAAMASTDREPLASAETGR
jgi:EAL domain-containing protein (putative c-di-GMP-specific phosphodiesterase class I)